MALAPFFDEEFMIHLDRSFEVDTNGVSFENGVFMLSGSTLPNLASVTFPTYFLKTSGDLYFTNGQSSWNLVMSQSQVDGGNASSTYGGIAKLDGGGA